MAIPPFFFIPKVICWKEITILTPVTSILIFYGDWFLLMSLELIKNRPIQCICLHWKGKSIIVENLVKFKRKEMKQNQYLLRIENWYVLILSIQRKNLCSWTLFFCAFLFSFFSRLMSYGTLDWKNRKRKNDERE